MKKILIVEDEHPLAKALSLKLTTSGFQSKIAANGEEGLSILKKEKFDLILLDLIMPKMDGFAFLSEIKKRKIKTKVLVTTNLSQTEDLQRAKELGATDYIVKSAASLTSIIDSIKKQLQS